MKQRDGRESRAVSPSSVCASLDVPEWSRRQRVAISYPEQLQARKIGLRVADSTTAQQHRLCCSQTDRKAERLTFMPSL